MALTEVLFSVVLLVTEARFSTVCYESFPLFASPCCHQGAGRRDIRTPRAVWSSVSLLWATSDSWYRGKTVTRTETGADVGRQRSPQGASSPRPTAHQDREVGNGVHGKPWALTAVIISGLWTPHRATVPSSFPKKDPFPPPYLPLGRVWFIFNLDPPLSAAAPSLGGSFSSLWHSCTFSTKASCQKSPSDSQHRGFIACFLQVAAFLQETKPKVGGITLLCYSHSSQPPANFWGKSSLEWAERGTSLEALKSYHKVMDPCVQKSPTFK